MAEPNEDDSGDDAAKGDGGRRPQGAQGRGDARRAPRRHEGARGSDRRSGGPRDGGAPRQSGGPRDGGAPRGAGGPREGAAGRSSAPRRDGATERDRRPRSLDASERERRPGGQSSGYRGGRSGERSNGWQERDGDRDTRPSSRVDDRPRNDDPELPLEVVPADLDRSARFQLKTLTAENAEWVARHLVMAARTIDEDPALAHRHALSAARRAGRIAVVRETVGITAYATGDFALALRELRTYRRISGSNEQLALMVDSERGLGRSDRAIELARSVEAESLSTDARVALAIAVSGARLDLGQGERALVELEIPELNPSRAYSYSPDLFRAYAEVLEELGRDSDAEQWRARADAAEDALGEAAGGEIIEVVEEPFEEDTDGTLR